MHNVSKPLRVPEKLPEALPRVDRMASPLQGIVMTVASETNGIHMYIYI